MTRAPLSPRRAEVLEFIRSEHAAGRGFPSRQKIASHMGWKHVGSSVLDVLHALHRRGYLEREWLVDGWKFTLVEIHGAPRERTEVSP